MENQSSFGDEMRYGWVPLDHITGTGYVQRIIYEIRDVNTNELKRVWLATVYEVAEKDCSPSEYVNEVYVDECENCGQRILVRDWTETIALCQRTACQEKRQEIAEMPIKYEMHIVRGIVLGVKSVRLAESK